MSGDARADGEDRIAQQQFAALDTCLGVIGKVFPGIGAVVNTVQQNLANTLPQGSRFFAMSPYVYFVPHAGTRSGFGIFGPNGNFNQPDVLVGLAKEGRDYDREAGAAKSGRRKRDAGRRS